MNPQVITFNCILKNSAGKLISTTYNHDVLSNTTNSDQLQLVALARGLKDLKKGEHRKISVSADEAYGFYDLKKVILYPTKKLMKALRIGQTVTIIGKSGSARTYTVLEHHDDFTSLDGNHPLAGQDLVFEIEALEVREATLNEVNASLNMVGYRLFH